MAQAATDMTAQTAIAKGMLIAVVGPSGVGKDSLMDFARRHFSDRDDVRFVRRVITRPPDGVGEDHDAVAPETFERLAREGAFAVSWHAHDLGYGIPADVLEDLAAGRVLVVNGSRSALNAFRTAFPRLLVVNITARPEILAERLAARGRETRQQIEARLKRTTTPLPSDLSVATIDNSGELRQGGTELVSIIERALGQG